ncbi:hypothetical protein BOX15_Mlig017955g2 [Macrostomum lignano]|nr:hypothetical protein BOX15_Mlig017955g2 [Macrostomum lignano]
MQLHLPPMPSNYFDKQFLPTQGYHLGDDVKLISCDMKPDMVEQVVGSAREILSRRIVNEQILPRELKEELDEKFGHNWQVVVTSGQFWAWFTHLAGYCVVFKLQRYCFLVWRTKTCYYRKS